MLKTFLYSVGIYESETNCSAASRILQIAFPFSILRTGYLIFSFSLNKIDSTIKEYKDYPIG